MKKLVALLLLVAVVVGTGVSHASSTDVFESRAGVAVDYEWTLELSHPLTISEARERIWIEGQSGERVGLSYSLDASGRTVRIRPVGELKYGQDYSIRVSSGMRSSCGSVLKNDARLDFSTEAQAEVDLAELVLGSWNTKYSGISAVVTFEENNICRARAVGITTTGSYSIDGSQMTVELMGSRRVGEVVFDGPDKFSVVTGSNQMDFWK